MHLNLRHLRAVATVTRLGSIAAAAQRVALTQPAITQAIAKLEQQIDTQLFERRSDGMVPTAAALVFTPRIEAALDYIASPRVTGAQLRALIAVADTGSYASAGATTGLAQPSLHRAVQDLSVALRRTLVKRSGRGLALTESGKRTARAFRLARAEIEAGLSEMAALRGRETGRIIIGAMPLSRARVLPAAVSTFHGTHPEATVAVVEGSHAELIEPLRDGALDMLIGALREQSDLFEDRPVIIARPGHPLADRTAPTIAELADYPWVIADPGTPLRAQWARLFAGDGIVEPQVPVECGSVMVIRQILRQTDFLTLLSVDQVALEIEAGWLVVICEAPPSLKRVIGITTRANWKPTGLQRAFLETLDHSR